MPSKRSVVEEEIRATVPTSAKAADDNARTAGEESPQDLEEEEEEEEEEEVALFPRTLPTRGVASAKDAGTSAMA